MAPLAGRGGANRSTFPAAWVFGANQRLSVALDHPPADASAAPNDCHTTPEMLGPRNLYQGEIADYFAAAKPHRRAVLCFL